MDEKEQSLVGDIDRQRCEQDGFADGEVYVLRRKAERFVIVNAGVFALFADRHHFERKSHIEPEGFEAGQSRFVRKTLIIPVGEDRHPRLAGDFRTFQNAPVGDVSVSFDKLKLGR